MKIFYFVFCLPKVMPCIPIFINTMLVAPFLTFFCSLFFTIMIIGYICGFGRLLEKIVDGIIGKIAAVIIAYFSFGVVLDLGFVKSLLKKFVSFLTEKNWKILLVFRVELLVLAVALYFVIRILQKLAASIIANIAEADVGVVRFINKTSGALLSFGMFMIIVLTIFQIIAFVNGIDGTAFTALKDSKIGLHFLFEHNPLVSLIETLKMSFKAL